MASTFYLEMLSPEDIFFSGNAQQIILPAIDGSHGILPGHEPMVTVITAGELRFQDEKGEWHMAVITDSCVEIMPERVILLAASIERPEEIDINRALAAKRRADEQEYYQTQAALSRALARLKSRGRE